ncbi:hypothetical protein Bhyg_05791, partial [Pseudolycoriella hygida]
MQKNVRRKCERQALDAFPNILSKSRFHKLQTPIEDYEYHIQSISDDDEKELHYFIETTKKICCKRFCFKDDISECQPYHATSLSFNTNQSQSLDFELSFRISKCDTTSPSEDMDSSEVAPLPVSPKSFSTIPKRKYTSNNRLQESKNKSSEIEVLRLRKECQNLIENNRRLMKDSKLGSERLNGSNNSVEETLLQTQVDSLQWQLKQ